MAMTPRLRSVLVSACQDDTLPRENRSAYLERDDAEVLTFISAARDPETAAALLRAMVTAGARSGAVWRLHGLLTSWAGTGFRPDVAGIYAACHPQFVPLDRFAVMLADSGIPLDYLRAVTDGGLRDVEVLLAGWRDGIPVEYLLAANERWLHP